MAEPNHSTATHHGTAIIALTKNGAKMARSLALALAEGENLAPSLLLERRFYLEGETATPFDLPVSPVVQQAFQEFSGLVIFLSAGACVRLLAPVLSDKHRDPAVVCVDDTAKFCVSLLSGHVGGGDRLAQTVASYLGATPVITSASHSYGTLAVDLLGREFGWRIQASPESITRASAAVVNQRPVGICQEAGETAWWDGEEPLPDNVTVFSTIEKLADSGCEASLVITDRILPVDWMPPGTHGVVYRPKTLVAGMGCRKGVPVQELESLLYETFEENSLSLDSLGCIATAELKRGEEGLVQLAERRDVTLEHYTADQLNSLYEERGQDTSAIMAQSPTPSKKAHELVGVWGVAEPAAMLASGRGRLLVARKKTDRATIAVARRFYPGGVK